MIVPNVVDHSLRHEPGHGIAVCQARANRARRNILRPNRQKYQPPGGDPGDGRQGGSAARHKPASVSREQMIAEAAYFRYEKRRGTDGDPAGDWLEAEQEIGWMLESDTER